MITRESGPRTAPGLATAAHLAARNLLAGLGPLLAAVLTPWVGLQKALLVTPACYTAAAALFWRAETLLEERKVAEAAAEAEARGGQRERQPG